MASWLSSFSFTKKRFRKVKAQMELNFVRDMKNNKSFFRYNEQKRQAKEHVLL